MFERRLLKNLDPYLILTVLALSVFGLVVIASATQARWGNWESLVSVKKQLAWISVSLLVLIAVVAFDYNLLRRYSNIFYGCILLTLVWVRFLGEEVLGAQRWIDLGPIQLQPSEFAKVLLILTLADHLARREQQMDSWHDLVPPFLHAGIPVFLVLIQPDLGTSMVFIAILFGMLYVAGTPGKRLLGLGAGGLTAAVAAVVLHLRYGLPIPLKDYQLTRLIVFIDPTNPKYILREGYHIYQSRIAIGSGQLWGQGLFSGRQTQLKFLPMQHTDFIFTVVGEELGFIGALALLATFFFLLWRITRAILEAKDLYGALLVTGVLSMIAFQVLVNIGMAVGIMPVTGLPLPFLSYGGSSLLTQIIGVGLVLNVYMRRHKILF